MSTCVNPGKKCCATCQHWKGEREIAYAGQSIRVAGPPEPCAMNPNKKPPSFVCPKYKEWVGLP